MPTVSATQDSRPPALVFMAGTALAGICLLLVNSVWTVLKETPTFWRDAGGYPVALRELVLAGYYPLLGVNALLCVVFTVLTAYEYRLSGRYARWALAAGGVLWVLLALNIALLVANNVENLLIGRELHYHLPQP